MNLSLRTKLIGATLFLLLFTVAIYAVVQVRLATSDLERETTRLLKTRTEEAKRLGIQAVSVIAASSHFWIADNDFTSLQGQIAPVVKDSAQTDLPITRAVITNDTGEILAFAAADANATKPKSLPTSTFSKDPQPKAQLEDSNGNPSSQNPAQVTVTAPIIDRNGKLWGFTQFVYDLQSLQKTLQTIEDEASTRKQDIIQRTLLIGSLVLLLGLLLAVLQALAIARPIISLTRSANRVAQGDLSARASVSSKDEIGQLATSFNNMAEQVGSLLRETAAKTAMERELEVARIIQETLLPKTGTVRIQSLTFAGFFQSASICGGDFWTHTPLSGNNMFLGIGDVTGHGVPSAMITAACKSGLDTLRSVTQGNLHIHSLMGELNKTVHEAAQRRFFMTFFGLIIDPTTGYMRYANAGHNFPILLRPQPNGSLKARPLVARGNRLGDDPTSTFEPLEETLLPGDMLCLYTDGITEYLNPQGQEYGERRFRRLLQRVYSQPPDQAIDSIVSDVLNFAGPDAVQEDDITLVIVHFGR